jgi:hypothetical protein
MSKRFAGLVSGFSENVRAGFLEYGQLPPGVLFYANGSLFLKTIAQIDKDAGLISFCLEDGMPLEIKDTDMVRLFSGSFEVSPSLTPVTIGASESN